MSKLWDCSYSYVCEYRTQRQRKLYVDNWTLISDIRMVVTNHMICHSRTIQISLCDQLQHSSPSVHPYSCGLVDPKPISRSSEVVRQSRCNCHHHDDPLILSSVGQVFLIQRGYKSHLLPSPYTLWIMYNEYREGIYSIIYSFPPIQFGYCISDISRVYITSAAASVFQCGSRISDIELIYITWSTHFSLSVMGTCRTS